MLLTAICEQGVSTYAYAYFIVTDVIPPVITSCAPSVSVTAGANEQATVPSLTSSVAASDSCGNITLSQSPAAGTPVPLGPRTITITVRDNAGLTSQCQTTLHVTPRCPGDMTLDGLVSTPDLAIFLAFFGQAATLYPRADCNADGQISTPHLVSLIANFGQACL